MFGATPFPTLPFYGGNPWFVPLAMRWFDWKDARFARKGARRTSAIYVTYLNGLDVAELKLTAPRYLAAIESSLAAQGRVTTVIEPRMHLIPDAGPRPFQRAARLIVAPMNLAGVKIVGDYVDNYKHGLPSEMAILNLFDPGTGMPKAILDATAITEMRTGAVTALGAKYWRGGAARCSAMSARAVPPIGTCACSTTCSSSTRSACIRGARKAATISARSLRDLGKPVPASTTGKTRQGGRHRGRGVAADEARAAAEDRWIKGSLRGALWDDERIELR